MKATLLALALLLATQAAAQDSAARIPPPQAQPASLFIEDLTWPEVRAAIAGGKTTAIYYAGSTEQNGPHMVLGKHNFIARYVAERIAKELGNALVYPVLPFAPTGDAAARTGHMRFPGSVTLSNATYGAVAREVALSAISAGFKNVALMGDHGGGQDALKQVAAELDRAWSARGVRVHYVGDLYFKSEQEAREYLSKQGKKMGTHAGISDTSELLYLDRNGKWLRRDKLAAGEKESGVDGDPREASAELGKTILEFKVQAAVAQIRRLAGAKR